MIEPSQITEESDSELSIVWSDGKQTVYNAAQLRKSCPCASCVNEWTGEKILNDKNVSADLTFNDVKIVGRYALSFNFSDGHGTGIYTFQFLRNL